MKDLRNRELKRLREHKLYWWAALCAPACYLAWFAAAVCTVILLVRPGASLATLVLGIAAVALTAAIVRAVAVETVLSRHRPRNQRSGKPEARRAQIYRASRRDGFAVVGRLIVAMLDHGASNGPDRVPQ